MDSDGQLVRIYDGQGNVVSEADGDIAAYGILLPTKDLEVAVMCTQGDQSVLYSPGFYCYGEDALDPDVRFLYDSETEGTLSITPVTDGYVLTVPDPESLYYEETEAVTVTETGCIIQSPVPDQESSDTTDSVPVSEEVESQAETTALPPDETEILNTEDSGEAS
jgi:hypothetical protein